MATSRANPYMVLEELRSIERSRGKASPSALARLAREYRSLFLGCRSSAFNPDSCHADRLIEFAEASRFFALRREPRVETVGSYVVMFFDDFFAENLAAAVFRLNYYRLGIEGVFGSGLHHVLNSLVTIGYPVALIAGVDLDTHKVFVHELPSPFSNMLVYLASRRLLGEAELRRLMGFTHHIHEVDSESLERGMRVRLHGDLVLEVLATGVSDVDELAGVYYALNLGAAERALRGALGGAMASRGLVFAPPAAKLEVAREVLSRLLDGVELEPAEPGMRSWRVKLEDGSKRRLKSMLASRLGDLLGKRVTENVLDDALEGWESVERGGEGGLRLCTVHNAPQLRLVMDEPSCRLAAAALGVKNEFRSHGAVNVYEIRMQNHRVSAVGLMIEDVGLLEWIKSLAAWEELREAALRSGDRAVNSRWPALLESLEAKRGSVSMLLAGSVYVRHREHRNLGINAEGVLAILTFMNTMPRAPRSQVSRRAEPGS